MLLCCCVVVLLCCCVVVLMCCGVVVLWCCGVVVLWCCGVVVLLRCGVVALCVLLCCCWCCVLVFLCSCVVVLLCCCVVVFLCSCVLVFLCCCGCVLCVVCCVLWLLKWWLWWWWLLLWCVVVSCVSWCVWLRCPCVDSKRPRVCRHHAHGDVFERIHGGRSESTHRRQGGSSSVLLTKICPRGGYFVLQRFTTETLGSFPFSSLRIGREQHVPACSNHSLYLMKLLSSNYPEGSVGGNQQLDGSISLSPLYPSITNDLHVSSATPPGFLLTLRFSSLVHHLRQTKQHMTSNDARHTT